MNGSTTTNTHNTTANTAAFVDYVESGAVSIGTTPFTGRISAVSSEAYGTNFEFGRFYTPLKNEFETPKDRRLKDSHLRMIESAFIPGFGIATKEGIVNKLVGFTVLAACTILAGLGVLFFDKITAMPCIFMIGLAFGLYLFGILDSGRDGSVSFKGLASAAIPGLGLFQRNKAMGLITLSIAVMGIYGMFAYTGLFAFMAVFVFAAAYWIGIYLPYAE